jgi:hypothetical protein
VRTLSELASSPDAKENEWVAWFLAVTARLDPDDGDWAERLWRDVVREYRDSDIPEHDAEKYAMAKLRKRLGG